MKVRLKLANATQLTDQLWIGGDLDRWDHGLAVAQLDELTDAGIDAIVDCRIEWDDSQWVTEAKAQVDYLSIGVEDAGYKMPDEWFHDGIEYAIDQIQDGHVVLAHCHAGINRGPSMGLAILLALGWEPIDALDLIKARRPEACVAYAEDAVMWWYRKLGAPKDEVRSRVHQVRQWRKAIENRLDEVI